MRGSIFFFALLSFVANVRAQSQADVWVVPVANDPESAAPIADGTRESLRAAGYAVPAAEAMTERFEQAISLPAPELSQRQIDEWVQRSTSAVRHLARADYEAARADLAIASAM